MGVLDNRTKSLNGVDMQAFESSKPPSTLMAVSEPIRAMLDLASLPWAAPLLATAPRGDGHPVLVLPGFLGADSSTSIMRRYLHDLGYDAHGWKLGRNLGERAVGRDGERLIELLASIYERTGKRVSVVGWSLGGFMARMLARDAPEHVRQVISMGAALTGNPRSTAPWVQKLYLKLHGASLDDEKVQAALAISATPPPVPSTSIFSKCDGITAWQNCLELPSATTDNIEVRGSHSGLSVSPSALYAVADRLALAEGDWKPFRRDGWRPVFYPSSGHCLAN